jgi:predicted XRE-type DNA-binding protein
MSRASLEQLGNLAGDIDKLEATRQRLLVKRDVMIKTLADKQFKSSAICEAAGISRSRFQQILRG